MHNNVLINHSRCGPRLDGTPLASVNSPAFSNNLLDVPSGGISDPPILVSLIHAIKLSGIFSTFKDNCRIDPSRSWLVNYPTVSFSNKYKSFQGAALAALTAEFRVNSLAVELHEKAKTTLLPLAPFDMPIGWFDGLHLELMKQTPYIKTCWLKTITGAWCTSSRLASVQGRPCIFGCQDTRDELVHYLLCPILWQFARSSLKIDEESIHFLSRVCVSEPTSDKLKLLAFAHALYHCCVNDSSCMTEGGMPRSSQMVQHKASEVNNYCLHLIGNR